MEIPEFRELPFHRHERDSLVCLVEQKDFLFEPGETMVYNNPGYFILDSSLMMFRVFYDESNAQSVATELSVSRLFLGKLQVYGFYQGVLFI